MHYDVYIVSCLSTIVHPTSDDRAGHKFVNKQNTHYRDIRNNTITARILFKSKSEACLLFISLQSTVLLFQKPQNVHRKSNKIWIGRHTFQRSLALPGPGLCFYKDPWTKVTHIPTSSEGMFSRLQNASLLITHLWMSLVNLRNYSKEDCPEDGVGCNCLKRRHNKG
jgi:hypothetical protein